MIGALILEALPERGNAMLIPRFYFSNEFSPYEDLLRANGAVEHFYPAGSWMADTNQLPRKAYYILDGVASFSAINDDGDETIYWFMGAGSIYPIVSENMPRFSLEPFLRFCAGTDCTVLEFPATLMAHLASLYPDILNKIILHYCYRCNLMESRQLVNSYQLLAQRVYSFLYIYIQNKPEHNLTITLSQEQIAGITGVSRVHLTRILKELRQQEIISLARRKLTVISPQKLFELCNSMIQLAK